MTYPTTARRIVCVSTVIWLVGSVVSSVADDRTNLAQQVELLMKQNAALQETVKQQQSTIESLNRRVGEIESRSEEFTPGKPLPNERPDSRGVKFGPVSISGEGAVALFSGQANSAFPETQFRVDEAKLFFEAPIWGDVYFFTELNLATREDDDIDLNLGELYLDWEDLSKLWGATRQLNLRVGRMDIPFGDEYLYRDAIDDPLISHSLPDTWGIDEGLELYGSLSKFSYVVAIQNGGVSGTRDFDGDKSVAGRLSYDPNSWLHFSLSGMRTGDLDASDDYLSEIWFGGGWFRSIGSPSTTTFHANLVQSDVSMKFSRGLLRAFGGYAQYDDNDPTANNRRDFYYYSVEGVLDLTKKFYTAARFSQVFVDEGYPMPGQGNMSAYFFDAAAPFAEELWRCSIGVGYRFSPQLIVKTEYSFEGGEQADGTKRDSVNIFAAQAAFRF